MEKPGFGPDNITEVGDYVELDEEIATIETDKVKIGVSDVLLTTTILIFTKD